MRQRDEVHAVDNGDSKYESRGVYSIGLGKRAGRAEEFRRDFSLAGDKEKKKKNARNVRQ